MLLRFGIGKKAKEKGNTPIGGGNKDLGINCVYWDCIGSAGEEKRNSALSGS